MELQRNQNQNPKSEFQDKYVESARKAYQDFRKILCIDFNLFDAVFFDRNIFMIF